VHQQTRTKPILEINRLVRLIVAWFINAKVSLDNQCD
jgi:hypothetical protein